jgi:tetratricopeptide (TPR) repeat protein
MAEKTCFVVMGFGKKTDFPTGRTLDLDKSYRILIKPAVEAAGLQCIRADDIVHAGSIELTMYRHLLEADVVVADISTCNPNALYELGVRHALRPYTTIIITEDQTAHPFDVNHILIRKYQHLGAGIDAEEADRFRSELTGALRKLLAQTDPDSPVYTFITGLRPPIVEALVRHGPSEPAPPQPDETLSMVAERAETALMAGQFERAKALFRSASELANDDHFTQRLALATYKSGAPTEVAALNEAREILQRLNPEISNDPETLGLWGAVHKRLWKVTAEPAHLDTAILAYERGFDIRTDYYNGINLALLLNVRAQQGASLGERIADFVNAERVRRRVIPLCLDRLAAEVRDDEERYWVTATLAEAYFGIGDQVAGEEWLEKAYDLPVADWMRESTGKQIGYLQQLLVPSPLELIPSSAGHE